LDSVWRPISCHGLIRARPQRMPTELSYARFR